MSALPKQSTDSMLKDQVLSIVKAIEDGDWGQSSDDENEQGSAYDYLRDVLDINWILNSDRSYKGARLLVAFGGPNIWIDTNLEQVEGYWWGEKFIAQYNHTDGAIELDQTCEELMGC
jgi:hypothetical protein